MNCLNRLYEANEYSKLKTENLRMRECGKQAGLKGPACLYSGKYMLIYCLYTIYMVYIQYR